MSDTPDKMADEPVGDDVIMAYADGALAPDLGSAVRDVLATSPSSMQKFESFLFTRGPLARPYDAVLAAPIPDRLLQAVLGPPPRRTPPRTRPTGSLLDWLANSMRAPAFAIPAILIGAGAGWLAHDALRSDFVTLDSRGLVASVSLQRTLDQAPGGKSTGIAGGLAIKPTFTFATSQKAWCRQYELVTQTGNQSGGLACRGEDGVWRVIAQTQAEAPSGTPGSAPDKAAPASKGDDVLDGIRAQIKDGDVLGPNEEERLIKERWQTKP